MNTNNKRDIDSSVKFKLSELLKDSHGTHS